jgi:hypothetical protein
MSINLKHLSPGQTVALNAYRSRPGNLAYLSFGSWVRSALILADSIAAQKAGPGGTGFLNRTEKTGLLFTDGESNISTVMNYHESVTGIWRSYQNSDIWSLFNQASTEK